MLAQASNLKDAIAVLEDGMKGTLADYTIASVTETQLMDVFPLTPIVSLRKRNQRKN